MDASIDTSKLLERVANGDESAFAALYDALAPAVFGAVKRVLRDPAMSEEVLQEVFIELWKSAPRFDSTRATANTFAITIARRRAVDRVRREQSQRDRVEALRSQHNSAVDALEDEVTQSIADEQVRSALAELPDDQREVVSLAFIDGLAHGAIADRLDIPLGTVKGRVRGGLKKMRLHLGDVS